MAETSLMADAGDQVNDQGVSFGKMAFLPLALKIGCGIHALLLSFKRYICGFSLYIHINIRIYIYICVYAV